jgi:hypothetical protein
MKYFISLSTAYMITSLSRIINRETGDQSVLPPFDREAILEVMAEKEIHPASQYQYVVI